MCCLGDEMGSVVVILLQEQHVIIIKEEAQKMKKFRNNKTDTRKVQVTPQALLPKRTRQAYLTQNMELM